MPTIQDRVDSLRDSIKHVHVMWREQRRAKRDRARRIALLRGLVKYKMGRVSRLDMERAFNTRDADSALKYHSTQWALTPLQDPNWGWPRHWIESKPPERPSHWPVNVPSMAEIADQEEAFVGALLTGDDVALLLFEQVGYACDLAKHEAIQASMATAAAQDRVIWELHILLHWLGDYCTAVEAVEALGLTVTGNVHFTGERTREEARELGAGCVLRTLRDKELARDLEDGEIHDPNVIEARP